MRIAYDEDGKGYLFLHLAEVAASLAKEFSGLEVIEIKPIPLTPGDKSNIFGSSERSLENESLRCDGE